MGGTLRIWGPPIASGVQTVGFLPLSLDTWLREDVQADADHTCLNPHFSIHPVSYWSHCPMGIPAPTFLPRHRHHCLGTFTEDLQPMPTLKCFECMNSVNLIHEPTMWKRYYIDVLVRTLRSGDVVCLNNFADQVKLDDQVTIPLTASQNIFHPSLCPWYLRLYQTLVCSLRYTGSQLLSPTSYSLGDPGSIFQVLGQAPVSLRHSTRTLTLQPSGFHTSWLLLQL